MSQLTDFGLGVVSDLSNRYGISEDAVITMIQAVINGNGTMAQFYCPELGGSGQWMQGGMTMVGDMFNTGLQSTVSNLCGEISSILASGEMIFAVPSAAEFSSANGQGGQFQNANWWPEELGFPSSSGAQNNVRYAIFPDIARLAVDLNGEVTVYDTLDHQIGGVGQQQGNGMSVTFTSQYGTVFLENLPIVYGDDHGSEGQGFEGQQGSMDDFGFEPVDNFNNGGQMQNQSGNFQQQGNGFSNSNSFQNSRFNNGQSSFQSNFSTAQNSSQRQSQNNGFQSNSGYQTNMSYQNSSNQGAPNQNSFNSSQNSFNSNQNGQGFQNQAPQQPQDFGGQNYNQNNNQNNGNQNNASSQASSSSQALASSQPMTQEEVFNSIERLGKLRDQGYLSDEEFIIKKNQFLQRL
ncbi:MAG: SHOCT domain-containing protein [Oceanobacter sp.]